MVLLESGEDDNDRAQHSDDEHDPNEHLQNFGEGTFFFFHGNINPL
jgi:hypothetical protein